MGEKHNCAQHNKSLRQAGNLKTHLLIHTGENHTRAHNAIIQPIKVLTLEIRKTPEKKTISVRLKWLFHNSIKQREEAQ